MQGLSLSDKQTIINGLAQQDMAKGKAVPRYFFKETPPDKILHQPGQMCFVKACESLKRVQLELPPCDGSELKHLLCILTQPLQL